MRGHAPAAEEHGPRSFRYPGGTERDGDGVGIERSWLGNPRIAAAVELAMTSPTGREVLEAGSRLRTKLVFEATPTTHAEYVDEVADGLIASYHPTRNRMTLGFAFGIPDGVPVTRPDGSIVHVGASPPAQDAATLVHETVHRVQNRHRLLSLRMAGDAFVAPISGVRELVSREPKISRVGAFMRGFDRRMLQTEIAAFRTEDRMLAELGEATRFHSADGAYLGDAAVQAVIGGAYATQHRMFAGAFLGLGGAGATLGVRDLTSR